MGYSTDHQLLVLMVVAVAAQVAEYSAGIHLLVLMVVAASKSTESSRGRLALEAALVAEVAELREYSMEQRLQDLWVELNSFV